MKVVPKMQRVIEQIARKHQFDLKAADGSCLVLEMDGYQPLVICAHWTNLVQVYHYFMQHGDIMYDPEMVFFVGYPAWVPYSITQSPAGVYREVATLSEDCQSLTHVQPAGQRMLAEFAEQLWAPNLKAQGWLEHGQRRQQ